MTPGRRDLRFETFDAVNTDVEQLLKGCTTVGAWTLGQICNHLATVTNRVRTASPDGLHDPSLRLEDEKRDQVLSTGVLPEGLPLPAGLGVPDDPDPLEAARSLREALAAFADAPGPFAPHRLFGPLDRDQWRRLVRIHCAHHLSFASPLSGSPA